MQFINAEFCGTKEEVIDLLSNNELVNHKVKFDEKLGKPQMRIKEKNGKIRITCEMIGGASKDNGFIIGTFCIGKLKENNGVTRLRGVVMTAPFYHLFLFAFLGIFIYQCIKNAGFSVIPLLAIGMSIFLFKNEFKKQGIIKRYVFRAARRMYESKKGNTDSL